MFGVLYTHGGKLLHLLLGLSLCYTHTTGELDPSLRSLLVEVFMFGELHTLYLAFYIIYQPFTHV